MGGIIKLSDKLTMDSSEVTKSAAKSTNHSLLQKILNKHDDENARTRVRAIQVCRMQHLENMLLNVTFMGLNQVSA